MATQLNSLSWTKNKYPIQELAYSGLGYERMASVQTVISPHHSWYLRWKRVCDICLALLLAIPALPLIAIAAIAIKLTSRGPIFYLQTRVGLNGRLFTIFKLRTMIDNCEAMSGPKWAVPGDPRITPVGWILRATHIDELPQLLNVLVGDMSLVGPRPERPEFLPELERAIPAYRKRLNIRPGVTGLAQVQLAPDTNVDSVRRKLIHDLYYIRYLSPWLDMRLIICTCFYAIGIPFWVLSALLRIPSSSTIEREYIDQEIMRCSGISYRRVA